jgi:thymidine kinase
MTPKEKAMELIEKFEKEVYKYDLDTNNEYDMSLFHLAKQCALIAIDEAVEYEKRIIKEIQFLSDIAGRAFRCEGLYWEQVKHEIEKL